MPPSTSARPPLGALALGLSALLFLAFPLIRPFFVLDVFAPDATLAAASPALSSAAWLAAHLIATLAFVLLLCALPTLYPLLAGAGAERGAWRAMLASLAGIALILPTLGVETYAMPAIGRVYLTGARDIAPVVALIYRGLATLVMLAGLALLAGGAIAFARAIWQRPVLSRGAGLT